MQRLNLWLEIVAQMVNLIADGRYDDRIGTDRVSVRESVDHMAERELILRDRILLTVEKPGCGVVGLDDVMACDGEEVCHL